LVVRPTPSPVSLWLLVAAGLAALGALLAGVAQPLVMALTAGGVALLILAAVADYFMSRRAWFRANVRLTRQLPAAFAIGVERPVRIAVEHEGKWGWVGRLYDNVDPSVIAKELPAALTLPAGKRLDLTYTLTPTRRGEIGFSPAQVRLRSRFRLVELFAHIGSAETRRVYPDFAQIARYAWLAGDRRLQEIGIKTYQQRGEGTDFKQLSEYRHGDSVRHIDWKATLRLDKPVVREFQDERDQRVMLLIDCGRRMRADDRRGGVGTAHFDQVLNAVMLLAYVALGQGDAVGALTFGTPPGGERLFAPRKGMHVLTALMGELYGVQPTPSHSDYVAAAQDLLRRQAKRALVIVITNFRDEDGSELGMALKLLRSRHLVLLASVRERIVGELMTQPLSSGNAALEVASAHLYEQSRRDAFHRLATREALMVDAEPERLGIELVNRYHAVKRAGML
jgi:uncharacterized protein (DUF58 family)